jgi:hypothetical protein
VQFMEKQWGMYYITGRKLKAYMIQRYVCVFRRGRKITRSDNRLRHVCPSVRLLFSGNNSAPTGRIIMKFYISVLFFKKTV